MLARWICSASVAASLREHPRCADPGPTRRSHALAAIGIDVAFAGTVLHPTSLATHDPIG